MPYREYGSSGTVFNNAAFGGRVCRDLFIFRRLQSSAKDVKMQGISAPCNTDAYVDQREIAMSLGSTVMKRNCPLH